MENLQVLADRIKGLCDQRGVSTNKMLIDSGAGARTYHNILAGSAPSSDKLTKIADYLNVSVDYLLGRSEDKKIRPTGIGESDLSEREKKILSLLRKVPESDMPAAERMLEGLAKEDS